VVPTIPTLFEDFQPFDLSCKLRQLPLFVDVAVPIECNQSIFFILHPPSSNLIATPLITQIPRLRFKRHMQILILKLHRASEASNR